MHPCIVAIALVSPALSLEVRQLRPRPELVERNEALHQDFQEYMQKYKKDYAFGSEEYQHRLAHYSRSAAEVERLNQRPGRLWTAGTGPLADRSEDELESMRGWFGSGRRHFSSLAQMSSGLAGRAPSDTPQEFLNWTSLKALSAVRDQGGCGSCWAVTASTVLDSHAEIYKSEQRSFSAQELVSCVPNVKKCGGTGKCGGATVELAFQYALDHPVQTSADAPYEGTDGTCMTHAKVLAQVQQGSTDLDVASVGFHAANPDAPGMRLMTGWERLPENAYAPLIRAVYERGPVAVSVDATKWSSYESGVFDSCDADAVINHAVTLIGYGKDKSLGVGYYLIQNSWGPSWGEDGKIRLLRKDDDDRLCGIDHQPQEGTGCEGGPKEVRVCGMCGILYDNAVPHFLKPAKSE